MNRLAKRPAQDRRICLQPIWLLVFLIVLQLTVVVLIGMAKDSFFIDEIYSYGLSNSQTGPFLRYDPAFFDTWHDTAYFHDYLVVTRDARFRYATVYQNQVLDVHPPLYYLLLHTVCSFFPGVFSKWFGIGLNLAILVGCQLVLYRIGLRLLRRPWRALLPGLLWGCLAAVNNTLFIRMYLLLTLMTLLLVLLHIGLVQDGLSRRRLALTALVLLGGLLTHYYLVILAFMLGFALTCYLLWRRRWRDLLLYGGTMLAGLLMFLALFPAVINHLFGEARIGAMTRANLLAFRALPSRAYRYLQLVLADLFGRTYRQVVVGTGLFCGLALLGGLVWRHKKRQTQRLSKLTQNEEQTRRSNPHIVYLAALVFVTGGTFLLIALIAAVIETRYLYFLYPLFCLGLVILLELMTEPLPGRRATAVVTLVCLFLSGTAAATGQLHYLYAQRTEMRAQLQQQYSNSDCLFVTEYSSPPSQELLEMMVFRGVYITKQASLRDLPTILLGRDQSAGLVVIIDVNPNWSSGYVAAAVLDQILATGLFTTAIELYRYGLVWAYHLLP